MGPVAPRHLGGSATNHCDRPINRPGDFYTRCLLKDDPPSAAQQNKSLQKLSRAPPPALHDWWPPRPPTSGPISSPPTQLGPHPPWGSGGCSQPGPGAGGVLMGDGDPVMGRPILPPGWPARSLDWRTLSPHRAGPGHLISAGERKLYKIIHRKLKTLRHREIANGEI